MWWRAGSLIGWKVPAVRGTLRALQGRWLLGRARAGGGEGQAGPAEPWGLHKGGSKVTSKSPCAREVQVLAGRREHTWGMKFLNKGTWAEDMTNCAVSELTLTGAS